jgi:hypothetical protein
VVPTPADGRPAVTDTRETTVAVTIEKVDDQW